MIIYGNGSIIRLEDKPRSKCRKWRLVFETSGGRRTRRFAGTYSQAQMELEKFKAELLAETERVPAGLSLFRDRAELFLERRRKSGERTPETQQKDRQQINVLEKHFGRMRMCEITPQVASDGLLEIKDVNGYAPGYMAPIYAKMKAIMREGVRDGEIATNPLEDVKPPRIPKTSRRAMPEDLCDAFLLHLDQYPFDAHKMAVLAIYYSGIRRGECVALDWRDVSFRDRCFDIGKSVTDKGRVKGTKNGKRRRIPIPHMLLEYLIEWLGIQKEMLANIHVAQTLDTPVITSDAGTRMSAQNLDRWWRRNRKDLGVDGWVLHELRHTYLTRLGHTAGTTAKDLQDIAGWSSLAMAETYVHEDEESKRRAVDALFSDAGGTSSGTSSGTSEAHTQSLTTLHNIAL